MSDDKNGTPTVRYSLKEVIRDFKRQQEELDRTLSGLPIDRLKGVPDRLVQLETEVTGLRRILWMMAVVFGLATGKDGWVALFKVLVP